MKFHQRLAWAQLVFCIALTIGVTVAISVDGGIHSSLWFFQLLLIFGAGFVFEKKGVLAQGLYTLTLAVTYYFVTDMSTEPQALTDFTSVLASILVFTALSYLYEREKKKQAISTADLLIANEELRQFAYRTSHDLKAPLTSIRSLAEVIREDIELGEIEETRQNATRIIKCADSLENLIVNILDIAKADIVDAKAEPIDLADIVDRITDQLSISGINSDNKVQINIELNHTGEINLPDARVAQILENLISNAIQYREPTEKQPFVKIASADKAGDVEITVLDNGMGISDKYTDRLFKMFQRFHPNIAIGSGLGLYIVKKHVDKLGASIEYRRTDNGSLFTLLLKRTVRE